VTESLLVGRFAAPTSAGILFAMLAAAGLSATWVFRKARVLAIFDDLDTVLLMMPLKMLVIGWAWSLGVAAAVMVVLFWLAWQFLHRLRWPISWPWVLAYAVGVTALAETVHLATALFFRDPVHIEVLLPAFVLGCMLARPGGADPHSDDAREGHQEGPESPGEQRVAMIVSSAFMVLVGLSMPPLFNADRAAQSAEMISADEALALPELVPHHADAATTDWAAIALHVVVLTVLINLGKMFPAFCYRREASLRERLALSIGLWPRGEVGAGVLLLSIGYGIGGDAITVAMLCLVLNLVLTGFFIGAVKGLLKKPTDKFGLL
jgi:Kef-type K+ transport system membrane component KefB